MEIHKGLKKRSRIKVHEASYDIIESLYLLGMGTEIFSLIPKLGPGVFIFFVVDLTNLITYLSYF